MSFLMLNGWQIPILKGGSRAPVIIGDEGRAFDGTLLRDRRVVKDRWQFETKHLAADDANALVGLLLGLGDRWPFDVSTVYSDKGLPEIGTGPASFRWGESADAADSAIESPTVGVYESKFGAGALAVEPATTNMLTEAQRRCSSTVGFTALAGAIATDTTYYLPTPETTGTSIKHTRAALNQKVRIDGTAIVQGTEYSISLYILTLQSGITVKVELGDDVAGVLDDQSAALTAGVWHRFEVTATMTPDPGGATTAYIFASVTAGAAAGDIYLDGAQLEQQPDPTTWADGARAAPDLTYSGAFLEDALGFTFAAWVLMPTANTGGHRILVRITSSESGNGSEINFRRQSGANDLLMYTYDPDGNNTAETYEGPVWDGDWHHIACTVGHNPVTEQSVLKMYVDGSQVDTEVNVAHPLFGAGVDIYPGSWNGGSLFLGAGSRMDEMLILPYAASGDQIAALAALTEALPTYPAIKAKGAAIETSHGVMVEGRVPNRGYGGLWLSGSWYNTAQRVQFELDRQ